MSKRCRSQCLIASSLASCAFGASFRNGPCVAIAISQESTTEPFLRLIANLSRIVRNVASASPVLLLSCLGRKILDRRGCHILGLESASHFFQAIKKTDIKSALLFRQCEYQVRIICVTQYSQNSCYATAGNLTQQAFAARNNISKDVEIFSVFAFILS